MHARRDPSPTPSTPQPARPPAAAGGRISRARLLRRVVAGAGPVVAGGALVTQLATADSRHPVSSRDRQVLEFALTLELLQANFYDSALSGGKLTGEVRQFAQTVGSEEHDHLDYLRRELGAGAGQAMHYRFGAAAADNAKFVAAAVRLEETGLAAYNGQATNLSRRSLIAVARVISVEARHAAWARGLAGLVPAPVAADVPISAAEAMKAISEYLG